MKRIGRRDLLPSGVCGLHDSGVEDHVGVDVVDAVEIRAAEGCGGGVEAAGRVFVSIYVHTPKSPSCSNRRRRSQLQQQIE